MRGEALINGRRVAALSGATFPCLSPIDGRLLALVAAGDARRHRRGRGRGARALRARRLVAPGAAARKSVLLDFAELIEAAAEELALLETLDMGKPICDALAVDMPGDRALHPLVRRGRRQDLRRSRADRRRMRWR